MMEIPAAWRESFGTLSDNSLHLLAKLYLDNRSLQKNHSRELIMEALWHHAKRKEFCDQSLAGLSAFDTYILLLLYLGLRSIQQLAGSLREYSPIEICLQLLRLQERLLVLQVALPEGNSNHPIHWIPQMEKQLPVPEGACFVIAPHFVEQLHQRLDFCALFCGQVVQRQKSNPPKLLLSSELLLASALYFAREGHKITKSQLAKCRECFPQIDDAQIQQLFQLSLDCGLLVEPQETVFSSETFYRLWQAPYYQRLLSLQAAAAGLNQLAFARLLSTWPQNVQLPAAQLQRLLSIIGIAQAQTANCIQTMRGWNILLEETSAQSAYYQLNPRLYSSVMGTENIAEQSNRLSSNWEFYCDLRHPENYLSLLLCARLEYFAELSRFRLEKTLFQRYFNAESSKFEWFLQHIPQLERCGIDVSEFIRQQWQEWFRQSTRFLLYKNCLLVCQPSHNELICRLLDDTENASRNVILSNPQPGVFYLNEKLYQHWRSKLDSAGIVLGEPFAEIPQNLAPVFEHFRFPLEQVQCQTAAETMPQNVELPEASPFGWDNWPTSPQAFVESRQLVGCKVAPTHLPIHFREARGVEYTAKYNLLHSLLINRNHMAIITVAEGDSLALVSYKVLPLSLDGPKENPSLLALELRQERLLRFRIKNITRVNEVFYSLIDACLFRLLPLDYIVGLETAFQEAQS